MVGFVAVSVISASILESPIPVGDKSITDVCGLSKQDSNDLGSYGRFFSTTNSRVGWI